MIIEKKLALKPILESTDGVHLTAYLVNRGDLMDLRLQLEQSLEEFRDVLTPVMNEEELKRFLEPLNGLCKDSNLIKGFSGNIGIFRNLNNFRVLSVPIELEHQSHVASSFHVKPLLRWLQIDREFLLVGIGKGSAHIYHGSQNSIVKLDSIKFQEGNQTKSKMGEYLNFKKNYMQLQKRREVSSWLNDRITQLTLKSSPKLFVAGESASALQLLKNLNYSNLVKTPIAYNFEENQIGLICKAIRHLLFKEVKSSMEKTIKEFKQAEDLNLVKRNLFQIAKAAVQGKVRKLIVADGVSIFGKIDKKTGGLAIHPFDLDHEDDDILDDLAQTVLALGGEVVVAPRDTVPKGRHVLAIIDNKLKGGESLKKYSHHNFLLEAGLR